MRHSVKKWAAKSTLVLIVMAVASSPALARPTNPTSKTNRAITLFVKQFLERNHVSQSPIGDESSHRCLETFLKSLDPWKLYFYQSDIDEFMQKRDSLDDLISAYDVSFAYTVFDRFLARVDERVQTALTMVDAKHDFTVDEEMIRDRDDTVYPRTPEEATEAWRKRVKFDLLNLLTDETEADETKSKEEQLAAKEEEAKIKLRKRYNNLKKSWEQTSDDELLELYLSAFTMGFDPHSNYMSASTLDNFEISMKLQLDGIGASLRGEDGYTTVQEIIDGGAAARDGRLKKGDQIVGVAQDTSGPFEDIVDMKLNDVVKLIRGKRGTIVRLQVKPVDNPKETVEYVITRDRIELKDQEARSTIIEWGQKPSGGAYKLGVIQLPSFYMDMDGARLGKPDYKSTTRDVKRLLEEFNQKEVDAVVVDLRFNGGGSLTEAVNMSGLFIDQGPVVQVKGPDGRSQPYRDPEPGMLWSGPLVVLCNKFSASASEIFAGAIQDYGRGLVVGDDSTHGKGTVQQMFNVGEALFRIPNSPNYGALKLTIQKFYRPGGDSTQNRGVLSDVQIPSIIGHFEGIAESDLDYALAFDKVRPLEHDEFRMIDPNLISQLQQASAARIAQSPDFAKDIKRIERYEDQKEEKTVTLNMEKYLAERAELDTDKEQEKLMEETQGSKRPVFEMDHYGKEALSIVVDYLKLLKENKVAVAR